ncbi:putative membrane protein YeiH [Neisseria sp. HSC-16F19]|nr:trimeric intracellular cation channel family protein [Neisseria sp. HSC-16F19]MCP2040664.1 putative membrane protein YeiH [Neisseria sp. HSC-16F19]
MNYSDYIHIIGTVAFAVSGYLVGFRKQLDVLGVVIVALLSAVGGGMIRDVIIGRLPLVFTNHQALVVIFLSLFAAWALRLQRRRRKELHAAFILADAIGLAAFSLTGAQVGVSLDLNIFGVVTLAFVTSVGGGIVRDMLVNEVPVILRRDLYGSIAVLNGLAVYVLAQWHWLNAFTLNILFLSALLLRLMAFRWQWELPGFQQQDNDQAA